MTFNRELWKHHTTSHFEKQSLEAAHREPDKPLPEVAILVSEIRINALTASVVPAITEPKKTPAKPGRKKRK